MEEETRCPTSLSQSRDGGQAVSREPKGRWKQKRRKSKRRGRGVYGALAGLQALATCSPGVSIVKPHSSSVVLLILWIK